MASLILGAGVLAYDQVKKSKEKRAAKKAHNDARYTTLEQETTARLSSPPASCSCKSPTWPGGECPTHGYVPAPISSKLPARTLSSSSPTPAVLPSPYSEPASPTSPRAESGWGYRRAPSYSDVSGFRPGMANGHPSTVGAAAAGGGSVGEGVDVAKGPRRPSYRSQSSAISGNFVSISSGGSGGTGAGGGSEKRSKTWPREEDANTKRVNPGQPIENTTERKGGMGSWWKRRKGKKGGISDLSTDTSHHRNGWADHGTIGERTDDDEGVVR